MQKNIDGVEILGLSNKLSVGGRNQDMKWIGRIRIISVAAGAAILLTACDAGDAAAGGSGAAVEILELRRAELSADESADRPVRRWSLEVPVAMTVSHRGGDDPFLAASQSVRLNALIDWEAETLTPSPRPLFEYDVSIVLSNSSVGRKFRNIETCLTFDDSKQIASDPEGIGRDLCEIEDMKYCPVTMSFDGWGVRISLPRELYMSDPQPACAIIKKFLNGSTIEREYLTIN